MDAEAPGERLEDRASQGETVVHLTWETLSNGHRHKPATLLTNDPTRPKITFAAEGEVSPRGDDLPAPRGKGDQRLGDFERRGRSQGQIRGLFARQARPQDHRDDHLTSRLHHGRPEDLPEALRKEIKTEAGRLVVLTIKRGMTLGTFLQELVIKTDHPKEPELAAHVDGQGRRPDRQWCRPSCGFRGSPARVVARSSW